MKKLKEFFDFKTTEMRIAEQALKKINKLEPIVAKMSDEELKSQTDFFKELIKKGHTLEEIRNDVFAVSREATKRVLGKRPYDVQMLGGLLLDLGSVAEMKTGEGKTITSIAPVYLNALLGKGAIVSTVNEYLSERDAEEMGQVFKFLGLTVGVNKAQMDPYNKRNAYACDITYSVHSELGFDYLRDNMVSNLSEKVQRGLQFCLIDEVDSILIDEAKTPLIISGGEQEDISSYFAADQFVRTLGPDDYVIDDESKSITLTHSGIAKANKFYKVNNLYDIENSETVHLISNALRAHKIMKIDVEYIVREGKIELVDAFTGRIMDGRSYSEGLQQALQAKEMVEIEPETKTLATITYQNFFRMFKKLCGMTGTGKTEEQEFIDIYNMRVNVVPTNKPIARVDEPDSIFVTSMDKWNAAADKIAELYAKGQPVLVGTAQIEDSEALHKILLNRGIPHTVLNAKQNSSEAEIISRAGQVKSVTIATNMAGRGTDIKPSPEAIKLGGLYVLGTDRAESRRIDNQLRGRSGRQGDVGTSKFFVSLEDQLMQRFADHDSFKDAYRDEQGKEITSKQLAFGFKHAQKKIEGFNYDSRKSVLNYDDVIRQQRDLIYSQRDLILSSSKVDFIIQRMIASSARSIIRSAEYYLHNRTYNYEALVQFLNENIGKLVKFNFDLHEIQKIHENDLPDYVAQIILTVYEHWKENALLNVSYEELNQIEKEIILTTLDNKWQNHINKMDKLRSNVNLVQYSQKNPYQVYTEEGTKTFEFMLEDIAYDVMLKLFSNRIGQKSIITKEVRQDPLFQQLASTYYFDPNLPFEDQEKQLLEIFTSIKNRLAEIEEQAKAEAECKKQAELEEKRKFEEAEQARIKAEEEAKAARLAAEEAARIAYENDPVRILKREIEEWKQESILRENRHKQTNAEIEKINKQLDENPYDTILLLKYSDLNNQFLSTLREWEWSKKELQRLENELLEQEKFVDNSFIEQREETKQKEIKVKKVAKKENKAKSIEIKDQKENTKSNPKLAKTSSKNKKNQSAKNDKKEIKTTNATKKRGRPKKVVPTNE
ncbi:preprotein translocase subunit SecA [Mycoplasmopsis glycophila]|uniref:Protein translocase subunit SecA n=1 Tax=Mycoplasmopsis glycophila TaxID=171285 RepID=A0A449AVH6_9BACT|nr:preprotein translocase subunit SecA [Mycoplasmopsis glycophila]VEU70520.1 preprotein translocase subunit SecA [Mycoplasmopsis glycophila]